MSKDTFVIKKPPVKAVEKKANYMKSETGYFMIDHPGVIWWMILIIIIVLALFGKFNNYNRIFDI
jgi:hypothetical protein